MLDRWLPWRWLIRRAARSYGLLDPFALMARLGKFAEPSEVEAPLELIRAGIVTQARGIVNSRAIQHNLDWVWPYWVERQFDPRDASFIPRAFSLAHINLTHRNWTAVCVPDYDLYSLVDPRGLVTPLHDGWSVDAWVLTDRAALVPSRCGEARQELDCGDRLTVATRTEVDDHVLASAAWMEHHEQADRQVLRMTWDAEAPVEGWLCVALRPYNPEGIQFIDSVEVTSDGAGWLVNGVTRIGFDPPPVRTMACTYAQGDVFNRPRERGDHEDAHCAVGMATAAALFPLDGSGSARASAAVYLQRRPERGSDAGACRRSCRSWKELDRQCPALVIPDRHMLRVYQAAARTLLALSSGEVYPGPYTYRRFWVRDACVMLNALLALNQAEACQRALSSSFPRRQTMHGFFESQEGEWDSNGQVLWLAGRYHQLSGCSLDDDTLDALRRGAEWIRRKRQASSGDPLHDGLLPAGFSAEHLGPNNYYYWDDFWGVAGLRRIAAVFRDAGQGDYARELAAEADDFMACIERSIGAVPADRSRSGIPAAPNRRMDSGAVGSLAADYPLHLLPPADPRVLRTVEFLLENCMVDDGFFHDVIHSGINPYLTLHIAQVLLRAGDGRFGPLMARVAGMASPTGQWPEAVHPATGGGCMGDGQHGWAAAEWVLMMRALFVREEAEHLVIGSGVQPEWMSAGEPLAYGPTGTAYGSVSIEIRPGTHSVEIEVDGEWRGKPPALAIRLPGCRERHVEAGGGVYRTERTGS